MYPILLDFGTHDLPLLGTTHLFLPTYGMLLTIGVVLAWWWFMRRTNILGVDPERAFSLTFYTLLAGLIGAKLTLVAVEWRYYISRPSEILGTLRSAGVLMGGVACGALAFVLYARRHGLSVLLLADAVVAPVALAQAIGRLGCFAAGCCWGVAIRGGWPACTFTNPEAAARTGVPLGIPLAPTQLLQAGSDLALATFLTWLYRRRLLPQGQVLWWYCVLYGIARGVIEIWRGDAARGLYFGGSLSTSQIFSIASIALGVTMLVAGRFRRRETASP
jgi:phosphatidylglycerol:prolipoprotein diacylglycerol transferase